MRKRSLAILVLAGALLAAGCRPAPPPAPPRILAVTTDPPLPTLDGGWRVLPRGAGAVTIRIQARNATLVRVYLMPTGTETGRSARLLGEDAEGADGWTVVWRYGDTPLTAHLLVQAEGPGGVSEDESLEVVHD